MKRSSLIISLLLFAFIAALWAYVQSDAFGLRIRPLIAGPLQEVLGPGASIGRIKASLLPLYLEVRDIVIPSAESADAVAIRRIRVYLNPFPLMYGRISIPSVTVLEPRVQAARTLEGAVDLAGPAETVRGNLARMQSPGKSAYSLHIRAISVRNAKAVITDAGSRATVAMSRLNMKIKMNLSGGSYEVRLSSGDLLVTADAIRPLKGQVRGSVDYDQGRLAVNGIEMTAEDTRLSAAGSVGIGTGGGLDLKITSRIGQRSIGRLTDVLRRAKRTAGPSIEATARIAGTIKKPIVNGTVVVSGIEVQGFRFNDAETRFTYQNGSITVSGGPWNLSKGARAVTVQNVSLEGAYQNGRLRISRAAVLADDLAVNGDGTIGMADGYQLALSAASSDQGRSLSLLSGFEISGPVNVRGTISGPIAMPLFDGRLDAGPVNIRSVPFRSISGDLAFREKVVSIANADIEQGNSRYDFNGSVDLTGPEPIFQAKLDVFRSDVASIVALFYERIPLELSATGELSFRGSAKEYRGSGHLKLDAGIAYGESFDRGSLTVGLTTDRITFQRVHLEKKAGTVSGEGWIGFDGTYDAQVRSEGQDLSEVDHLKMLSCSGPFVLDIRSSGSFSAPTVKAHASSERLSYKQIALGALRIDVDIRNGELTLTALTQQGTFSANGSWTLRSPYPWSLAANVRMSDVDPSLMYNGSDILAKVRVAAEGAVRARGKGADLSAIDASAQVRKLGVSYGDLRLENDGDADIRLSAGRVAVNVLTLSGAGTRLSVTGGTRLGKDLDLAFTGDANLSLLRIIFREVDHGDGTATVKLAVSDAWSNPEIAGELVIRNGQIKIRDIPQKFTALNGTIDFTRDKVTTEALSGEVGGGTITIAGNAQLDGSKLEDFSAKASIENVTVRYPAGLTAAVGGVLYYDGDASAQTLSGEVLVRKARYEKRVEWKSMLVDFSRGFTQKRKTDIGWIGETQLGVRFVGKENIVFESNLAKIPLDIDMLFQGTVNQPQVLGRVEARKGEVYFRKNVFRILHASADFTDPNRINPTLDVQAETRVREYQIQLGVSGTADRAVVTFVSEPALTDSNILALLALGRKGEELKGKEANIGVGEATSFATGKFQDILESRARSLTGLDRFQVDPYISKTDTAVPRVTVGKEVVQDKLFMTYSSNVGATSPEQVFRIEYILNRNLSLIGERNEVGNLGADVKFRFEFR